MPTITELATDLRDRFITAELAVLGLKVGDRVFVAPVTAHSKAGVVVGCQVSDTGFRTVMFNWENEASGTTRSPSHIHSSHHGKIPGKTIWSAAREDLVKETPDIKINIGLAKCGLVAGQVVTLCGTYQGIAGIVCGISKEGTPILSIYRRYRHQVPYHNVSDVELYSFYSGGFDYTKVTCEMITGAKVPTPIATDTRSSAQIRDDKISAALAKDNLSLGQVVYWKNSRFSHRKLLVVGHDGNCPIVTFTGYYDCNKIEHDIIYNDINLKERYLHSNYMTTEPFKPFSLDKANIVTQVSQPNLDSKIIEGLRKIGFKLGDQVEYCGTATCPAIVGIVVGYACGNPVILPANSADGIWTESTAGENISSIYVDKGFKFLAVDRNRLKKTATPSPFVVKPFPSFPEIAVKGLVIKKKSPIRADLKKAGYRIVAKQSLKLTHGVVCNLLKKKGASNEKVQALASILSTEYGKAAMSMLMGYGIAFLPMMKDGAVIQGTKLEHLAVLGEEFRIGGMTIAGNELVETIFKSALEVLLSAQESEKKIRVSSEDDSILLENHLMEDTDAKEKRSA